MVKYSFWFVLLWMVGAPYATAQLCTGSLGDPIVNINFGAGTSIHKGALPSGTTSYSYSSADFPMDGSYTVENSTAGSGQVWWSTKDHTGDAGGYMMVVNASISKTDYFFKTTVNGLCPGTLFEFSAWVMNLLRSSDLSPPDITFQIEKTDGSILASYTTGAIARQNIALWRQFGFYFSTPVGVSTVVIRMRNNSAGGAPANDIALDDITFRPCGPTVLAWINGSTTTTDTLCTGSTFALELQGSVSSGYSSPHYQWQVFSNGQWNNLPGDTNLTLNLTALNLSAGSYTYRMAAGEVSNFQFQQCLVVSNTLTLVVEPQPTALYTVGATQLCANQPVAFLNGSITTGPVVYSWDFGDGNSSSLENPNHLYEASGTYLTTLIVGSLLGCADTTSLLINVELRPAPMAKFTIHPTDTSIFYPTVYFTDQSTSGSTCSIDWGDGVITDCSILQHDYTEPGIYVVKEIVAGDNGCTDTATIQVTIRPEFRFFIPNAFTPDGDGLNDTFKPSLFGVYNYRFMIFNRFGQQIFDTTDPDTAWDGTYEGALCAPDIYVYKIIFSDEVSQSGQIRSGTVMVVK